MAGCDIFGKVQGNEFCTNKDSEILEAEWLRDHNGETVRKSYRKPKRLRTLNKLNFFKGVFLPRVAEETGHTIDEVQDWYKAQHMTTYRECPFTGKTIPHVESWANTTDERASELIDYCMADAWNLSIPLQAEYEQFMEAHK